MSNAFVNHKSITHLSDLTAVFTDSFTTKGHIGLEYEFFLCPKGSLTPVDYATLSSLFRYLLTLPLTYQSQVVRVKPIQEGEFMIGLYLGHLGNLSLEPGGQFEFSAGPVFTHEAIYTQWHDFYTWLSIALNHFELHLVAMGFHPFLQPKQVVLMPKKRYQVMQSLYERNLSTSPLSLHMMKLTTALQANIDYHNEQDAMLKFKLANYLQLLLIALCANSALVEGGVSNSTTFRSYIWRHTANDRSGLHPMLISGDLSFNNYVQEALAKPVYFIQREDRFYPQQQSFGELLNNHCKVEDMPLSLGDWLTHLSTLFYEVRLKPFVELRGLDSLPYPFNLAVGQFIRTLLVEPKGLALLNKLIGHWDPLSVQSTLNTIHQSGLTTIIHNASVESWLKLIVEEVEGLNLAMNPAYLRVIRQLMKHNLAVGSRNLPSISSAEIINYYHQASQSVTYYSI